MGIDNPEYRGKWSAPMIDNPDYIGEWAPKKIKNPNYYENSSPVENLASIGAVAIEILANDVGIGFDNIILSHDIDQTRKFAQETFVVKQENEKKSVAEEMKAKSAKERNELYEKGDALSMVKYYYLTIKDF